MFFEIEKIVQIFSRGRFRLFVCHYIFSNVSLADLPYHKIFFLGNNVFLQKIIVFVQRTTGGYICIIKLVYPDGHYEKEDIEEIGQFPAYHL